MDDCLGPPTPSLSSHAPYTLLLKRDSMSHPRPLFGTLHISILPRQKYIIYGRKIRNCHNCFLDECRVFDALGGFGVSGSSCIVKGLRSDCCLSPLSNGWCPQAARHKELRLVEPVGQKGLKHFVDLAGDSCNHTYACVFKHVIQGAANGCTNQCVRTRPSESSDAFRWPKARELELTSFYVVIMFDVDQQNMMARVKGRCNALVKHRYGECGHAH